LGLANIRNSMDEFSLASTVPTGTQLRALVRLHPTPPAATTPADI
jgi:hypothetical protein